MEPLYKRLTSRKFLLAVAAFVAVVVGLVKPDMEANVEAGSTRIVELILASAPTVYIIIEGLKDWAVAKSDKATS